MTQYIDISVLVSEIEKCYNECLKRAKITDSDYWNAKADAYRSVLVILNNTTNVLTLDDIKGMEHQAFLHGIDVERNKNIFKDKEIKI